MTISLRFARQLLLVLAVITAAVLGACRDGGVIDPPGGDGNDSCCAVLKVAVTSNHVNGPLGGVAVALRKGTDVVATKETNDDGVATFTNVCNGEYNLRLTKTGYSVAEKGDIHITECDTTRVTIAMSATGTTGQDSCCNSLLRIIPTDPQGNPVAGAQVKITGPNGQHRILESTLDGATFREVCRGLYQIRIAREGFAVHESQVEIGCNVEKTERRMLQRGDNHGGDTCCDGRIVVGARDAATGQQLQRATVKLWRNGQLVKSLVIEGQAVTFGDLCEGSYGISIHSEGYQPVEGDVVLHCNATIEFVRSLHRNAPGGDSCCDNTATIRLINDRTRGPVANAVVKLYKGGAIVRTGHTNGDGVVRFEDLCQGEYGIFVDADGYHDREARLAVICRQPAEATITLIPTNTVPPDTCCDATIALTVYDGGTREQVPLAGVTVVIKAGDRVIAQGVTTREGAYRKGDLCNRRTYLVVLEREGYQRMALEVPVEECNVITRTVRLLPN
jgi:hypothetical protein